MQIICKNCDRLFERQHSHAGRPRVHCSAKCGVAYNRKGTRLRYRNDPAFREAMKASNLQRYHDRKSSHG